jgi:hypothetical protein
MSHTPSQPQTRCPAQSSFAVGCSLVGEWAERYVCPLAVGRAQPGTDSSSAAVGRTSIQTASACA